MFVWYLVKSDFFMCTLLYTCVLYIQCDLDKSLFSRRKTQPCLTGDPVPGSASSTRRGSSSTASSLHTNKHLHYHAISVPHIVFRYLMSWLIIGQQNMCIKSCLPATSIGKQLETHRRSTFLLVQWCLFIIRHFTRAFISWINSQI